MESSIGTRGRADRLAVDQHAVLTVPLAGKDEAAILWKLVGPLPARRQDSVHGRLKRLVVHLDLNPHAETLHIHAQHRYSSIDRGPGRRVKQQLECRP